MFTPPLPRAAGPTGSASTGSPGSALVREGINPQGSILVREGIIPQALQSDVPRSQAPPASAARLVPCQRSPGGAVVVVPSVVGSLTAAAGMSRTASLVTVQAMSASPTVSERTLGAPSDGPLTPEPVRLTPRVPRGTATGKAGDLVQKVVFGAGSAASGESPTEEAVDLSSDVEVDALQLDGLPGTATASSHAKPEAQKLTPTRETQANAIARTRKYSAVGAPFDRLRKSVSARLLPTAARGPGTSTGSGIATSPSSSKARRPSHHQPRPPTVQHGAQPHQAQRSPAPQAKSFGAPARGLSLRSPASPRQGPQQGGAGMSARQAPLSKVSSKDGESSAAPSVVKKTSKPHPPKAMQRGRTFDERMEVGRKTLPARSPRHHAAVGRSPSAIASSFDAAPGSRDSVRGSSVAAPRIPKELSPRLARPLADGGLSRVAEELHGGKINSSARKEDLASALCMMEDSVRNLYEHGPNGPASRSSQSASGLSSTLDSAAGLTATQSDGLPELELQTLPRMSSQDSYLSSEWSSTADADASAAAGKGTRPSRWLSGVLVNHTSLQQQSKAKPMISLKGRVSREATPKGTGQLVTGSRDTTGNAVAEVRPTAEAPQQVPELAAQVLESRGGFRNDTTGDRIFEAYSDGLDEATAAALAAASTALATALGLTPTSMSREVAPAASLC